VNGYMYSAQMDVGCEALFHWSTWKVVLW